jgi:RNA polymerase sigma-70 factor (ECF subfamily)
MSDSQDLSFETLEDLFRKSQQGDKQAYARFLKELYPFVKHKVQQKLGDLIDCDDITQECLIGIHRSIETYDPDKALKPWVLGVIKHKLTDFFRQWGRRSEVDLEKRDEPVTNPDSATNTKQTERVWSLIDQLPEPQKRALVLTQVSGLSTREASLEEGISEAAFRKRISRAYKQLRDVLSKELEKDFGD